jgi:hypothetical protein
MKRPPQTQPRKRSGSTRALACGSRRLRRLFPLIQWGVKKMTRRGRRGRRPPHARRVCSPDCGRSIVCRGSGRGRRLNCNLLQYKPVQVNTTIGILHTRLAGDQAGGASASYKQVRRALKIGVRNMSPNRDARLAPRFRAQKLIFEILMGLSFAKVPPVVSSIKVRSLRPTFWGSA